MFILETHNHSCHSRLRDKVGEAVREFWLRAADIRSEIEMKFNPVNNNLSTADRREENSSVLGINHGDLEPIIASLQSDLVTDLKLMLNRTLEDGKSLLNEVFSEKLQNVVEVLCSLHPCHEKVAEMASTLIRMQVEEQQPNLLQFFTSYAKKKLEEVLQLSVQQFRKANSSALPAKSSLILESKKDSPVDLLNCLSGVLSSSLPPPPPPSSWHTH
jgi:hypothetical protein